MASRSGFETLARFGYAARGAVYFLIAMLALFSGFAGGGEPSTEGALGSLLGQPFGRALLGLIAAGLAGFVLWRLVQSLGNAEHREGDAKGFIARAGQFASGVAYGALAVTAAQMALGGGRSAGGGSDQSDLVAWLMSLPFGNILAGIAGAAVLFAGGAQIYEGFSGKFKKRLQLPAQREKLLSAVSTYGLVARGVVFAIIGGFLIYAAFTFDPQKAGSLPEALDWVAALPFGRVLYVTVALGLIAFAGYGLIQARYGKVNAPTVGEMRAAAGV